jgi:hypothetical protein
MTAFADEQRIQQHILVYLSTPFPALATIHAYRSLIPLELFGTAAFTKTVIIVKTYVFHVP